MRAPLNLSEDDLAVHLQIIAHATHTQLDTATHLLGGSPDAVLEVLEVILGVHLLAHGFDDPQIEAVLGTFSENVLQYVFTLRRAAAAAGAPKPKPRTHANDN